jgi:hypothetical protein
MVYVDPNTPARTHTAHIATEGSFLTYLNRITPTLYYREVDGVREWSTEEE